MKRLKTWWVAFRDKHAPVLEECPRCLSWFRPGFVIRVAAHRDDPTGPTVDCCIYCIGLHRRDQRGKMRPSVVGRRGNW